MCRNSQTSALISSIFSVSAGVGLDQQVVDLGGDGVRVLVDERREHARLADRRRGPRGAARSRRSGPSRSPRRPARPRRRPASRRAAPRPPSRAAPCARWAAVRVTITSSRSPGTITSVPGPDPRQHVVPAPSRRWRRPRSPGRGPGPGRSPGRARPRGSSPASGSTGSAGTAARPSSGIPWRARPRRSVSSIPGCSSTRTLFTIAPATGTPCAREVRRVEHDLVDRPPDAALGHDHRRRARASARRPRSTARSPPRRRRARSPR